MKYLLIIAVGTLLLSCDSMVQQKKITVKVVEKKCDNGYHLSVKHETTKRNQKVSSTHILTVKKDHKEIEMQLKPAKAASGSKYTSINEKYMFWEHQNEFSYGTEDSVYCTCQ